MPDKFPEAFDRFTRVVSIKNIKTWEQMQLAFDSWADPRKWIPTARQRDALATEARKRGIDTTEHRTRDEQIRAIFKKHTEVKQQTEIQREKRFSKSYVGFDDWSEKTARTTAYQRRIISYLRNHPDATLAEARGHRAKRS
jgi:hypothetical protein